MHDSPKEFTRFASPAHPYAGRPVPVEGLDQAPVSAGAALSGKRLVLCVTGSIAAYKSVFLLRLLQKAGAHVEVVLTPAAERFVGAASFEGFLGRRIHRSPFEAPGELHVELAANADAIVIAPATADSMSRLAAGQASDLVSAVALCASCPVVLAPAMHPRMWQHPATQRNVSQLLEFGSVHFVGPVEGEVASGDQGLGRMAEPEEIVAGIFATLGQRSLDGKRVVITAGPTIEDLDPVRYISNRSSGKMGFALAARAHALGAEVTLIAGPVNLPTPGGVRRINVRSALSMQSALWQALKPDLSGADVLIMAAAVADYRPEQAHATKIKRETEGALDLRLLPNPDLLAEVGHARQSDRPLLVGFALETNEDDLLPYARRKLMHKRADLIIANRAEDALEGDDNTAMLVSVRDCVTLGRSSKPELAAKILDWVTDQLSLRAEPLPYSSDDSR